jgi:hypothetical protein
MNPYGSLSDDFYVNMHLHTEMDLPNQRETVLHFFEQMQRRFPKLRHFYQRERGEFILEEDKEHGAYRWVAAEPRRMCSGIVNPNTLEEAMDQHREVLDVVPYAMSISKLDCESIGLMYGFDYSYRGNQNLLLANAIGLPAGFEALSQRNGSQLMSYEPVIQLSLDDSFRTHARINFETRTTAFQAKAGEYNEELLSVYVTVRRFDSLGPDEEFTTELNRLECMLRELMDDYIVENILKPLQNSIAAL